MAVKAEQDSRVHDVEVTSAQNAGNVKPFPRPHSVATLDKAPWSSDESRFSVVGGQELESHPHLSIVAAKSALDVDDQYMLVPSDTASIDFFRSLHAPVTDCVTSSNGSVSWTSTSGIKVRSAGNGCDVASLVHPRTSDVFLVVQGRLFEAWPQNQDLPSEIVLRASDIARDLYRSPKHGGVKTEHRQDIVRIVESLSAMELWLPEGMAVYASDPKTRRRKPSTLPSPVRALAIRAQPLHEGQGRRATDTWRVRPPQWLKHFPRQFTPIPRALIERPARHEVDHWVKSIGVELAFFYRQDRRRGPDKTLKVSTLIKRAGLQTDIDAMVRSRHGRRAYEQLGYALDQCADLGAIAHWCYHPQDNAALQSGLNRGLDRWYTSRVLITAPDRYATLAPRPNRTSR